MRQAIFVCVLLGLLLLGCKGSESSKKGDGEDWTGFLGPTQNSASSEKGIIAPWPAKGLRIVWHQELGTGYSAPSIRGDKLFIFDRLEDRARLRALNRSTGATLWTFDYPTDYRDRYGYNNGPRCCPVIDEDRVYVYGAEGMLHCVSADAGKVLWKVDTVTEFSVQQNFFGVGSTPIIEGDLLIAVVGGSQKDDEEKPNGTAVIAFDKKTGKVQYKFGDELAAYSSPVTATISGRRWCFVLARGGLLGFDPKTGKQDFHFPWRSRLVESVNAANPVVVDDAVFISETYSIGSALLKVKPGDYEVLWSDKDRRDKSMKAHWTTPIYHEGYLYGDSGRNTPDANLRCIELATGKVMWVEEDLGHTSLLKVDGHLVCLTEAGRLRLLKLNPKKYEEVSRMNIREPDSEGFSKAKGTQLLTEPCWAAPVLSHGLLYLRGPEHLVCLELIP